MSTEKTTTTTSSSSMVMPLTTISWSDLQMGQLIGDGGYADVYLARWQGIEVAVKQLRLKTLSGDLAADFQREATIMAQCQFPYVVRLYGVCQEPGHVAMVMEYLPKGSLDQVLHDSKESLPWNPIRWGIAIDIGKGLSYLHNKNIIHRDLKSLNVLLDSQYHAKITDFGLAKIKLESSSTSTKTKGGVGTARWRAPESFKRGVNPNKASDVYSYGMVLWEIATRQLPFSEEQDDQTVISWIKDGEQEKLPQDCPESYVNLVQACWKKEPNERPLANELVEKLTSARPQSELPQRHGGLRHFYGEDEDKRDQRLPGQAYTFKALRYVLPMLRNRTCAILYVHEEQGSLTLKEALHGLSLLSKALGRLGILVSVDSDPKKAVRALLVFAQQCIVVEVSPAAKLTPIQKGTLEELQDEQILDKVRQANPLSSDAVDAKDSAVVLVGWLSKLLKQPSVKLLEGFSQIEALPLESPCRLETLDAKSFQFMQGYSLKNLRKHHEALLSDVPEQMVSKKQAISEEAFVQSCYESLPQHLLPLVNRALSSSAESFVVKSKQLRNLLWDERITPLVQEYKALSKQLSEAQVAPILSATDIKRGKFLAEGRFGQVYEGFWLNTKVAVKVLKGDVERVGEEEFKSEIGLMLQVNHPRIVRCYGLCLNPMQGVFELMEGGSLEDRLRSRQGAKQVLKEPFPDWSEREKMLLDIGEAIHYLHMNHMVHGDLRASNFLLNPQSQVKLGDFGLAKKQLSLMTLEFSGEGYIGKTGWLAPELLSKEGTRSFASDVYSFGMVIWELVTGYEPFSSKGLCLSKERMEKAILGDEILRHHELPSNTPEWVKAIFVACLGQNPAERPLMSEVLQVLCLAINREKYQRLYRGKQPLQSGSAWLQKTLSLLPGVEEDSDLEEGVQDSDSEEETGDALDLKAKEVETNIPLIHESSSLKTVSRESDINIASSVVPNTVSTTTASSHATPFDTSSTSWVSRSLVQHPQLAQVNPFSPVFNPMSSPKPADSVRISAEQPQQNQLIDAWLKGDLGLGLVKELELQGASLLYPNPAAPSSAKMELKSSPVVSVSSSPVQHTSQHQSQSTDQPSGSMNTPPSVMGARTVPSLESGFINNSLIQVDETKKLGEGGFGVVYRGKYCGQDVAVKQLLVQEFSLKAQEEFEHESQMMLQLRDPRVVHLYGVTKVKPYRMVLEYCELGSLDRYLQKKAVSEVSVETPVSFIDGHCVGIILFTYLPANHYSWRFKEFKRVVNRESGCS